jgi:hypothetical protein
MDYQRANRPGSDVMGIVQTRLIGAVLLVAGCFLGHELAVAGSILVGSALIASELRNSFPTS